MPRFFASGDAFDGDAVVLTGDDARHLAGALRARGGEAIVVVAQAEEMGVRLSAVAPDRVEGTIMWRRPVTGEPALRVHVLQALARDGMDDAVDALTEAGAASIRPVLTARTVARPDERRAATRVQRWRAIARAAAGQSLRGAIPEVREVMQLADAIRALDGVPLLVLDLDAARPLATAAVPRGGDVAVCIGPEGGFDDADRAVLRGAGAEAVHLGARVLRTRLAGAVAVALLLERAGDLAAPVAR